ncbi:hypothetical protein, variant 3 [Cladophialophora immunda]|uniref:C2H2-type domain-containing protein n=1 Tax=Cladophialophora immunda TaxID=569365 RepID=A0A0D1Z6J1_9EURO|nr:hypothetical protein, variant 3 [Cladophialophora immunda]KIW23241.1 hypothetical protein, variant 3 [Cladophialophora immunda]OQV09114.1 Zinc-finger double domain-containing protein isoform 2 [Cladophialophora immunda]OQV09115.1 Zinc-finger double domain-containing protein isoform 3 [Cladophialophora immunda]
MTMVIDNQGRHYGGITYDHMYPNIHATPQFSDPWSHQTSTSSSSFPALSKTDGARSGISMPYSHMPPVTGSMAQDMPRPNYGEQAYSSPAATSASYAPSYSSLSYAQSMHQQQQQQQQQQHRKLSDTVDSSRAANASFGELDASRGMLALSHQNLQDLTPRNIYEARAQRAPPDSYGFPQASSAHSSISNESGRGYAYYAPSSVGSVTDSATDYSSAASDAGYESMAASRTLPRPNQLLGPPLGPPAPQSMMSQFSSKMAANTQKKHKCKICDKRFTRPSSLQTHMYSHTGEKPFACDVEGCGRHFSVVSNLRRHKKVHKGDSLSSASHSDIEE